MEFTNNKWYLIDGRNGEANDNATKCPHPKIDTGRREKTASQ